ncbi:MAG: glycosyltransferase [Acetobacteraceae bacterium]
MGEAVMGEALGWIALFLAAGPLLLGLVNLRLLRVPPLAEGRPAVSVLIPARNEEGNIAAACAAVLASEGVEIELIVLDDASTDRTPDILRGIADPRLRVAHAPKLPPGWSGKQHACHVLGGLAGHELMVFVDADVRLAPDAVARMAGFMQRNPAGLASGFPSQVTLTWSERLLLPLIHFMLVGFLPLAAMRRSLSPGLGAGCGQLFITRREAYRRAGGHQAIRASLHDGLTLPRAFRRAGDTTDLFDAGGFARCRMYSSAAQVWEGLCKNATEGMAKPGALPIWTVILAGGHVLPAVLLIVSPSAPALLALLAGIGLRLVLAARFRQPVLSALLHPLGVAGMLAVQWWSLLRAAGGGKATWRGRAYTAQ